MTVRSPQPNPRKRGYPQHARENPILLRSEGGSQKIALLPFDYVRVGIEVRDA